MRTILYQSGAIVKAALLGGRFTAAPGAAMIASGRKQAGASGGMARMTTTLSPQGERALIRKIAWRTLPLILLSYFIAYVDRANISFAAASMNADLGFSETVYGIGAAAFFVGYAALEVPSNLLLARFGARRWLARIMATWGLISVATAFVHTPTQFTVMRFALGVAEAGFYPGVVLYLSAWFPGEHRAWAISRFYVALPAGLIAMGALAAPLLALDGMFALHGWQWLLIVEGAPAIVLAFALLTALPDSPEAAHWLGADERAWLASEQARCAATTAAPAGHVLRALVNPFVLAFGLANGLNFMAANAVVFSAPRLLARDTGWGVAAVGQVVSGGGALMVAMMLLAGWLVGRTLQRTQLVYALLMLAATVGVLIVLLGHSGPTSIIGYVIFIVCVQTAGMLPLAVLSRLIAAADRPAGLAMANTISQTFAVFGPLVWGYAADASGGGYQLGLALLLPMTLGSALVALLVRRAVLRTMT